jgi:hypothetical protein
MPLQHHMFLCHICAKYSSYKIHKARKFCDLQLHGVYYGETQPQSPTLILFSEVRFYLSRHVDLQNNKNWSAKNPVLIHCMPLHSIKFSVWCAVSATGYLTAIFLDHTFTLICFTPSVLISNQFHSLFTDCFW